MPESFRMYAVAQYGGETIAGGLLHAYGEHRLFPEGSVKWEYLKPSDEQKSHPFLGPMKLYNIEVKGHPTLKNAAWRFTNPPGSSVYSKDVAFRAFKQGDGGFGLKETGEKDGVDLDESWFG